MAYKCKFDRRFTEPDICSCNGFRRLKYSSLMDISRIERTRWRALLRFKNHTNVRWRAAWGRIKELGEAFQKIPGEKLPRRLVYEDRYDGQGSIHDDHRFWEPESKKPKVSSDAHALEQLAGVAAEREWEEEEARIRECKLLQVTDEKLAAGKEYHRAWGEIYVQQTRIEKMNRMLDTAVREQGILPTPSYSNRGKITGIRINGRIYKFRCEWGYSGLWDQWPSPEDVVVDLPKFEIDERLIGLEDRNVRARLGEPPLTFSSRKNAYFPNIWIYGSVGIRFRKRVVEKILDAKAVSRVLKTAK